ncbi:MAG: hypothetical protein U1D41_00650 [Nitrosomonas sp.]|uniref:hypothetical protein n=1 Tax=Nitrosomonas sp. TaxID=42353 RepID=UPI0027324644|nr:hypothetical protein [Nitrosomonas sp.]MDP1933966.1 hypothetical protein [Nitrosomonas sp.]MDP3663561.1 hypothetical protein [Nitrosomonas sp.]MDZ4104676.1 hypothetical protein [Nitrosomonas sp.]
MDQAEKKRKLMVGGALIATLIAAVLVEEEETVIDTVDTIQPVKPSGDRIRNQENNVEQLDVSKLGQRKFNALAGELFASTTWAPKQPQVNPEEQAIIAAQAAKASAPPPAPTAPPLQFKYAGKAIVDNETWVFLSQAGENLIAKLGGKINDKYRLDSINDDAITMTYLPLNTKQILTINTKMVGNF